MGFLQPNLPEVDHEVWDDLPRDERMRPMFRHYAESGFGSPDVVILMYIVKIVVYVAVGWLFVLSTPGIDGFFAVDEWWRNGLVFFKFVMWTTLFEVLGLGCGFGPLNLRFVPPMGAPLYWLRPGTIRLPFAGGKVPLTGGDERTVVDVVLYAAFLVSLVVAAWGDLTRTEVAVSVVLLAVLGLRDQVIFLAARGEVYGSLMLAFLVAGGDQITAAKLVMVVIWWGAATSKLNRHFPLVMATMQSNSPMLRFGHVKRKLWRDWPNDLRPSKAAGAVAHFATVIEFGVPLVMLLASDGPVLKIAAVIMILFHLGILTSFPMGVPLEWNVFMIGGIVFLFLAHPGTPFSDLSEPLLVWGLVAGLVAIVAWGNLVPEKVSFLPAMRYYAGNWAASSWCFRGDSIDRFDQNIVKASMLPHLQLEKVYGSPEEAAVPLHMGYAFRGFHTHGRALWTLVPRACGPDHEDFLILDGELVAGTSLGWNFGDGHLHGPRLIDALQKRCDFQPGDLRIVFVESQPFHKGTQEYRIYDAATGEIERGLVSVKEMVDRQPNATDVPLHPLDAT
ncbi:MAG: DUF3556 domain-containing protein [Actinobacteria bacterium]|nr:DUF3556 domain-containing protein [Actinomycetota bacterium]